MQLIEKIQTIMRDVFDNEEICLSAESSADSVEEWDSMNHVRLIVAVEEEFAIRLPMEQVNDLRNVGELAELIDANK